MIIIDTCRMMQGLVLLARVRGEFVVESERVKSVQDFGVCSVWLVVLLLLKALSLLEVKEFA